MKSKRKIIKIDEATCNGCGQCVSGCHEGALQLIDGKAQIVSELYCDGLGACIGECPVGAITIEEREAQPYDEIAVIDRVAPKGEATLFAHLKHLKDHGESEYLKQGINHLKSQGKNYAFFNTLIDELNDDKHHVADNKMAYGCSGSMARSLPKDNTPTATHAMRSQLGQWPVQLHLLNPTAEYFRGADVVLAADCAAYAYADFHQQFIRNHTLAIACPKLDSNKEAYVAKIADMIDQAKINTLTVVIMEVPCCGGLMQIATTAAQHATRKVPIKKVVIGVEGDIKHENWI